MINIGDAFKVNDIEKHIIKFIAEKRQNNKENTGLDGKGQANNKDGLRNNILGFAGEFVFSKALNLFPDFTILNTSKIKGNDFGDAKINDLTIDVKTSLYDNYLMTPTYSKSNIDLFAKFYLKNNCFIFQGFATNKMLFNSKNLKKAKDTKYLTVDSYVLETTKLLNLNEIITKK